jgi:hypothetical protein
MDFGNGLARGHKMNSRINDDILERLVAYEKYVGKLFARAARKRWLEINSEAVEDYERLKALKAEIASIVDLAFIRYGVEQGLMRDDRNAPMSGLDEDLEALAAQLSSSQWVDSCRSADRLALVR